MTKSALTTGDDGACLAEMLLKKCCELREIERCSSRFKADLVNPLHRNLHLARTGPDGQPRRDLHRADSAARRASCSLAPQQAL
jgi:GDP-D-mannose dehydratase